MPKAIEWKDAIDDEKGDVLVAKGNHASFIITECADFNPTRPFFVLVRLTGSRNSNLGYHPTLDAAKAAAEQSIVL